MPTYLELRVALRGVQPVIWRRFLIRAEATFAEVHEAIQAACGWENKHLYSFFNGRTPIAGVPDRDDPSISDAELIRFASGRRRDCTYIYDFGDSWEHQVGTEGEQNLSARFERRLLGGARAFPPEDCGGISGYEDCLAAIRGRKRPTAAQRGLLEWLRDWDPERFELERVAGQFDRPLARRAGGA